jgi:hypothetical protein
VTAPRLRFVRSLAVATSTSDARALLDGLGASPTEDLDAFTLGDGAVLVVPESEGAPRGFIPLFVTDDLQRACDHYVDSGLTVRDLPWDPRARAVLVGKGAIWVCVATATALYEPDEPPEDATIEDSWAFDD